MTCDPTTKANSISNRDSSRPMGEQEDALNPFNQKQKVDYKQIGKQVIKHPIKTAQKIVQGIKNGLKETGRDLTSGDAYRTGRGVGTVVRNSAEIAIPVVAEGKVVTTTEKTLAKATAQVFTKGDPLVLELPTR